MRRLVTGHVNTIRNKLRDESLLDKARRALAEKELPRFTVKLVKHLLSPLLEFGSVRFIEYQLDETFSQERSRLASSCGRAIQQTWTA